jgi:hypothetical protein
MVSMQAYWLGAPLSLEPRQIVISFWHFTKIEEPKTTSTSVADRLPVKEIVGPQRQVSHRGTIETMGHGPTKYQEDGARDYPALPLTFLLG